MSTRVTNIVTDDKAHYNASTVRIVVAIAFGAFSFAYSGAIIGTTLGQPSFIYYMGLDKRTDIAGITGTMTGVFYAGGVLGCILSAWVADRFGRRPAVATGAAVCLVAMACLAGSVNIAMFICFRFFSGLGAYMLYVIPPLWILELVPPKHRSILAGIVGLLGVVGYIAAAYVGVGFYYYKSSTAAQWRAPLGLGCFGPLTLLIVLPWLPESPRWLLAQGRDKEAADITRRLHKTKASADFAYADIELQQMHRQRDLEKELDASWMAILQRPSYRKRAYIAFTLPIFVYSTGNLVLTTYAASIFTSIGYNAEGSLHLLAGTYVAAIVGNLISLIYVDRIPRNIILAVGVLVVACILSVYTALLAKFLGTTQTAGLQAASACIFLFLTAFNMFLEGPVWYYAGELFPTHLRAKGITVSAIGFCLVNILWLEIAPTSTASIGWKYYLLFIGLSIVAAPTMYLLYPDTLKKPLEEVARLFHDLDLVAMYQVDAEIRGEGEEDESTVHIGKTA